MKWNKIMMTGAAMMMAFSLTACGNSNNGTTNEGSAQVEMTADEAQAQLDEILTSVSEAYGDNFVANMAYDETAMEQTFGVSSDLYDAYIAQGPLMSAQVDTIIGIHPTEGNKEAVVEALTAYREAQVNNAFTYPMNLVKIQASEVYEAGDYVFYIMLGFADDMIEDDEELLAAFQEQNQIAVDAINEVVGQ